MHNLRLVAALQPPIEIDHATHERRRKNSDAPIIEKIEPKRAASLRHDRVISEMRIPMDHPLAAERLPPCLEQIGGNAIPLLEGMLREL